MGQRNGLGTSEAIALSANCPVLASCLPRADLRHLGKAEVTPLQTESSYHGLRFQGSRLESLLNLRSLVLFLNSKGTPEMPVDVIQHPHSALNQATLWSVGFCSWEVTQQQTKAFSAVISMQPLKAPRIQFRMNFHSLSLPHSLLLPPSLPSQVT